MNLLILGGTRFLGRHLVDSALKRGHSLTLFNRGQSNPLVYPDLETIRGDRETDLNRLAGRKWDAVIDTCGYVPRLVQLSAQALRASVGSYVFISSISAYAGFSKIGLEESDPLGKLTDETVEEITGETYGPLKALCEQAAEQVFPGRALIIRPGLIVGPYDPTDRFTYWPVRVARGGEVLAPEKPELPVQIIDGRDLAEFTIKLIEQKTAGIFNVTGPDDELTFGAMLETCKQVSDSQASFKWASVEFLAKNNVEAWSDLPVWVPDTSEDAGFSRVNVSKAIAAGLTFRPLADTVRDTLDWAKTRPANHPWRAGLAAEREIELLRGLK
jgi:2'-hydroxyisoflavone reductase